MNQTEQKTRNAWRDSLLAQLRSAMQGSLLPCLPPSLSTRADQRRAIRIAAERLTFCYASANPGADAATLSICRNHLYAALTFLANECNPEDCIYDSLVRLMTLDSDLLVSVLKTERHTPRRLLRHYTWVCDDSPVLAGDFEAMVRLHLEQEGALPSEAVCTQAVEAAIAVLRAAV